MVKLYDVVNHIKDNDMKGIVIHIDDNLEDITTCRVAWDCLTKEEALACKETDVQWTNKLVVV